MPYAWVRGLGRTRERCCLSQEDSEMVGGRRRAPFVREHGAEPKTMSYYSEGLAYEY